MGGLMGTMELGVFKISRILYGWALNALDAQEFYSGFLFCARILRNEIH